MAKLKIPLMETTLKFLKNNIVLISLFCIVVVASLSWVDQFFENRRLHQELIGKNEQFYKLTQFSANLERKYIAQKDLLKIVKEEWKNEEKALRGRIKILSNATYLIREKARELDQSDIVYKGKKLKYIVNEIKYDNGPPIGYILIFDDGRVVSKLYNHIIEVKTAVARDESSGKYDIISKANYVLKSPSLSTTGEWYNKPHPLNIYGGTAFIDPTESNKSFKRFFFWAPNINANFNISSLGISPGLGVSLMGYGYSVRDLNWKFLQLGSHYIENSIGLFVTPILFRPFPKLLHNSYIGPGISIDKFGQRYFIGLQIGL